MSVRRTRVELLLATTFLAPHNVERDAHRHYGSAGYQRQPHQPSVLHRRFTEERVSVKIPEFIVFRDLMRLGRHHNRHPYHHR